MKLFIPKLQRCTFNNGCSLLSMLRFKTIHVSKRGPRRQGIIRDKTDPLCNQVRSSPTARDGLNNEITNSCFTLLRLTLLFEYIHLSIYIYIFVQNWKYQFFLPTALSTMCWIFFQIRKVSSMLCWVNDPGVKSPGKYWRTSELDIVDQQTGSVVNSATLHFLLHDHEIYTWCLYGKSIIRLSADSRQPVQYRADNHRLI